MSFSLRTAVPDDIPALARIHIESKRVERKNIVPEAVLDGFDQADYEQKWSGWLENGSQTILIEGVNPLGFISFGDMRTPPPGTSKIRPLYVSEIYAIYVLPDHFGNGYGRALFEAACHYLIENKKNSLCLWALDKNKRACEFYNALGGQRIGKQMIETGGVQAKELCYGWRDIKKLEKS